MENAKITIHEFAIKHLVYDKFVQSLVDDYGIKGANMPDYKGVVFYDEQELEAVIGDLCKKEREKVFQSVDSKTALLNSFVVNPMLIASTRYYISSETVFSVIENHPHCVKGKPTNDADTLVNEIAFWSECGDDLLQTAAAAWGKKSVHVSRIQTCVAAARRAVDILNEQDAPDPYPLISSDGKITACEFALKHLTVLSIVRDFIRIHQIHGKRQKGNILYYDEQELEQKISRQCNEWRELFFVQTPSTRADIVKLFSITPIELENTFYIDRALTGELLLDCPDLASPNPYNNSDAFNEVFLWAKCGDYLTKLICAKRGEKHPYTNRAKTRTKAALQALSLLVEWDKTHKTINYEVENEMKKTKNIFDAINNGTDDDNAQLSLLDDFEELFAESRKVKKKGFVIDEKTGEVVGKCKRGYSLRRAWDRTNERVISKARWDMSCFICVTHSKKTTYEEADKQANEYSNWIKKIFKIFKSGCVIIKPCNDGSWRTYFIINFIMTISNFTVNFATAIQNFERKSQDWWKQYSREKFDLTRFKDAAHLQRTIEQLKPIQGENPNIQFYPLQSNPIRDFGEIKALSKNNNMQSNESEGGKLVLESFEGWLTYKEFALSQLVSVEKVRERGRHLGATGIKMGGLFYYKEQQLEQLLKKECDMIRKISLRFITFKELLVKFQTTPQKICNLYNREYYVLKPSYIIDAIQKHKNELFLPEKLTADSSIDGVLFWAVCGEDIYEYFEHSSCVTEEYMLAKSRVKMCAFEARKALCVILAHYNDNPPKDNDAKAYERLVKAAYDRYGEKTDTDVTENPVTEASVDLEPIEPKQPKAEKVNVPVKKHNSNEYRYYTNSLNIAKQKYKCKLPERYINGDRAAYQSVVAEYFKNDFEVLSEDDICDLYNRLTGGVSNQNNRTLAVGLDWRKTKVIICTPLKPNGYSDAYYFVQRHDEDEADFSYRIAVEGKKNVDLVVINAESEDAANDILDCDKLCVDRLSDLADGRGATAKGIKVITNDKITAKFFDVEAVKRKKLLKEAAKFYASEKECETDLEESKGLILERDGVSCLFIGKTQGSFPMGRTTLIGNEMELRRIIRR